MNDDGPVQNTDRELWRGPDEGNGDYYADKIFVTQGGGIGINCGGSVIVMPLREWHKAASALADIEGAGKEITGQMPPPYVPETEEEANELACKEMGGKVRRFAPVPSAELFLDILKRLSMASAETREARAYQIAIELRRRGLAVSAALSPPASQGIEREKASPAPVGDIAGLGEEALESKSSWNYRIMRRQYVDTVDGKPITYEAFEMYECHYRQRSDTLPCGWAETPVTVSTDDMDGMSWMLSRMTEAASKPLLDYQDGKEIARP